MQLTARSSPRDRGVRIKGSVMDLYSRRPGMFENSRSPGMWPAEAPSAAPRLPLFSSFSGPASLSRAQWTLLGRLPTTLFSPPFFHDPPPRSPAAPPKPPAWRPK